MEQKCHIDKREYRILDIFKHRSPRFFKCRFRVAIKTCICCIVGRCQMFGSLLGFCDADIWTLSTVNKSYPLFLFSFSVSLLLKWRTLQKQLHLPYWYMWHFYDRHWKDEIKILQGKHYLSCVFEENKKKTWSGDKVSWNNNIGIWIVMISTYNHPLIMIYYYSNYEMVESGFTSYSAIYASVWACQWLVLLFAFVTLNTKEKIQQHIC